MEAAMRKRAYRHPFAEAFSRFTELPVESFCNIPLFCIKGREEAEVTGCRGILEYDEKKVVIKTCGGVFTVVGEGLLLSDFRRDVLLVRGRIDGVSFGEDLGEGCCGDGMGEV